jgi:hypothetical protein
MATTTPGGIYYRTNAEAVSTLEAQSLTLANSVNNALALIPIIPTSVTVTGGSATVSSVGQVTATGITNIMLNGVFSSNYTSYRIVMNGAADADRGYGWRLTANGVQKSDTFYHQSLVWSGGAGVSTSVVQNQSYIGYSLGHRYMSMSGDIHSPNSTAGLKHFYFNYSGLNSATSGVENHTVGAVMREAAYVADGIFFFPSAGNWSGNISIYGYRK